MRLSNEPGAFTQRVRCVNAAWTSRDCETIKRNGKLMINKTKKRRLCDASVAFRCCATCTRCSRGACAATTSRARSRDAHARLTPVCPCRHTVSIWMIKFSSPSSKNTWNISRFIRLKLTEYSIFSKFFAIQQHAIAKHALWLRVGVALGLPAQFADAFHSCHLCSCGGIRLQELFCFRLKFFYQLACDVSFLK